MLRDMRSQRHGSRAEPPQHTCFGLLPIAGTIVPSALLYGFACCAIGTVLRLRARTARYAQDDNGEIILARYDGEQVTNASAVGARPGNRLAATPLVQS
jgi:hypothetical protein